MLFAFVAVFFFAGVFPVLGQEAIGNEVHVPEKRLIAYWSFDEGEGTRVADHSGSGYHGNIANDMRAVQWVEGYKGKALAFDSTLAKGERDTAGAVVVPGFPTDFSQGLTVACRVKMAADADWQRRVFNLVTFAPGNYGPGFILYYNWRNYMFLSGPGGTDGSKSKWNAIAAVPDLRDQWVHVCATFDGKKGRIYIDGKLLGETPGEVAYYPHPTKTSQLSIGSGWGGRVNGFPGVIDELKIFNYPLTASEIISQAKLDW